MSFTSGTRSTAGTPSKADAEMDVLIANAESLITRSAFSGMWAPFSKSLTTAVEAAATLATPTYDVGTYYNVGTPTRITVPSGITYVQFTLNYSFPAVETLAASIVFQKNGSKNFDGNIYLEYRDISIGSACSPLYSVVATDYFEIMILQSSGGTQTVSGTISVKGFS